MDDQVRQVKERIDIVEVISSYLTLKKAGTNLKGPCPFHNEKTPSFMVSPERQTFKCFGCGEGGDVFTFIEKIEGVDFYNALKLMADRVGVKLESQKINYGNKEHKSDSKTRLFEINDWTKKFYHKLLTDHPKAQNARNYIRERGMTKETVENFEIGYAPESWDLLIKFLKSKNYTPEEMVSAGVVIKNEKGDFYDRFRGRIIFPINNVMGATIAFTSRILINDPNQAKYINSSESAIYTKGRTIYGLDKAKMAIRESNMAVFVEGNMDVIACHQAGFCNVVATSGTALTEDQIKMLSRYASTIAFSFDADVAGEAAMKKAVKLAIKNDINSKIIGLRVPFKDPDEAIKADPKNWQRAVESAKPALEYWIDLLIRKNPDLSIDARKMIAKEILPVIKSSYSEIEKEHYLKYLANKLSVSQKALMETMDKTKEEKNDDKEEKNEPTVKLDLLEKIVGMIWYDNSLLADGEINIKTDRTNFSKEKEMSEIIAMINEGNIVKEALNPDSISFLNQLVIQITGEYGEEFLSDQEKKRSELKFLLGRLRSEEREQLREDFAKKMKIAEEKGDREALKKILSDFSDLIK